VSIVWYKVRGRRRGRSTQAGGAKAESKFQAAKDLQAGERKKKEWRGSHELRKQSLKSSLGKIDDGTNEDTSRGYTAVADTNETQLIETCHEGNSQNNAIDCGGKAGSQEGKSRVTDQCNVKICASQMARRRPAKSQGTREKGKREGWHVL